VCLLDVFVSIKLVQSQKSRAILEIESSGIFTRFRDVVILVLIGFNRGAKTVVKV